MESRLLARTNKITNTSGLSPTHLQANLLILPSAHAKSFHDLCRRNPVSCPLLATTPPGSPHTLNPPQTIHSPDFDIRTDCPAYRIYKHGKCIAQRRDILDLWTDTDDYVGFLIGCSFSFEDALGRAGLKPRHQETGAVVPMYRTNLPLLPAGVFTGATCIVSMRPYRAEDVERVRSVTRRFLATHGEPVAWGWEGMRELGIEDIGKPDFGEEPVIREGEVPVFWGCGVTPQVAVESAGDKIDGLVFAHEPGNMLITDLTD
ncbi:DUF1445 domain protein [Aspergillus glaucus CBS 516.65]|uniref:DUF1445 domain-containing protein n=1 Tax=Aspergillus glaucus CBS 516.65 TaxID=1160497 RepID=A0A1L9V901_ASPGL|nr:hypothetical protein ASPGLDRAFT_69427 [Aspergillus glaucus CBS 516.65]OJJ80322.1 hypothetical protein ASPGLDRAFT_69427 [Aspergillus glaucus CBS 516.65]